MRVGVVLRSETIRARQAVEVWHRRARDVGVVSVLLHHDEHVVEYRNRVPAPAPAPAPSRGGRPGCLLAGRDQPKDEGHDPESLHGLKNSLMSGAVAASFGNELMPSPLRMSRKVLWCWYVVVDW